MNNEDIANLIDLLLIDQWTIATGNSVEKPIAQKRLFETINKLGDAGIRTNYYYLQANIPTI